MAGGLRERYATTLSGVDLYWNVFAPAGSPSNVPVCLVLHPGGYKAGQPGPDAVSASLAAAGFWGLSVEYRLSPPGTLMNSPNVVPGFISGPHEIPGQNDAGDTGHYPKQTTDVQTAMRVARADPRWDGTRVYFLGGSAGGSHTLFWCANGTPGDDMPDLAVICSCGVSNLADPNVWQYTDPGNETWPAGAIANYLNITNTCPSAPSGADLVTAQAASPITNLKVGMCPIFIMCSDHDSLGIPTSTGFDIQSFGKFGEPGPIEDGANGAIPKLDQLGYIKSVNIIPEAATYKEKIVTVLDHSHAFDYWLTKPHVPVGVSAEAIVWLQGGPPPATPPPPPPPNNLLGYRLTLNGPGAPTGIIGPSDLSAILTGLTPDRDYIATLVAYNKYGDSPAATYAFHSNPVSGTSLKSQPRGMFGLLSAQDGLWGDVSALPLWSMSYIDGVRARAAWDQMEPTEGNYQFANPSADIGALLALCASHGKKLGLSVAAGITTPQWVFDAGAVPITVTSPKPGIMPPPWDTVFWEKWDNFTAAFAAYCDNNVNLSYIVMGGVGQFMESTLTNSPADAVVWQTQAAADGYVSTVDGWFTGAQHIANTYMAEFVKTPVVITLDPCVPNNTAPKGGNAGIQMFSEWVKPVYSSRYGFMNSGLSENSTTGYLPNEVIHDQSPAGPAGFQFGHGTNGVIATYSAALTAGTNLLGKYMELYLPDAQSVNPAYQAATAAARTLMATFP